MALKSFETFTHELSEFEEATLLPLLIAKLKMHRGKANAITNAKLRHIMLQLHGHNIAEPRIRKMIEHIRQSYAVKNLVAGGKGYFVAETPEEMQDWLNTMKGRRSAISVTIAAAEKTLRKMTGERQPNQYKQRKADPFAMQSVLL